MTFTEGLREENVTWYAKIGVGEQSKHLNFKITYEDQKRFEHALLNDHAGFFSYESDGSTMVLNLAHVTFCHFLWEPGIPGQEDEPGAYTNEVKVFTAGMKEAYSFAMDLNTRDHVTDDGITGPFDELMFAVESITDGSKGTLAVVDADGEVLYFKVPHVYMMQLPRHNTRITKELNGCLVKTMGVKPLYH